MLTFAEPMEVVEVVDSVLFAIRWSADRSHELDELAEKLADVEFLNIYFEAHESRLGYFKISVETAVLRTAKEARLLLQELYDFAKNSSANETPDLDGLFEPLHKTEAYQHPRFYTDFKAKGIDAPWVRVYAVKLDDNIYVISGFGIKLVKRMQEDEQLMEELNKLEKATQYLKNLGML